jgi:hypothetical protein
VRELLDSAEEARAADAFFDFRCVDIAMGSGHFLVAAIDRIEARLSGFLALNPIPQVTAELDRLRAAAYDALGPLGEGVEVEYASLLRRQVARRCVYGVDINPVAVELARLGIWIHTFVPGLPLSFLDHSLVTGDSLTGIGTLDEALLALDPEPLLGQPSLFRDEILAVLGRAESALRRLARTADSSAAEIAAARDARGRDAGGCLPVLLHLPVLLGPFTPAARRLLRVLLVLRPQVSAEAASAFWLTAVPLAKRTRAPHYPASSSSTPYSAQSARRARTSTPSFICTTVFVPLRKVKIFVTCTESGIGGPEIVRVTETWSPFSR